MRVCDVCGSHKIRKPQWLLVNTGEIVEDLDQNEECAECGNQECVNESANSEEATY